MMWLRNVALAATLTAAACATLSPEEAPPAAPALEPFDLSGRVLVSHDGRAFSSGLRWQHLQGGDELWLLTPVGQALAHIVTGADGATFTGADRKQYRGASVERLTREALGWELPLTRLQYWVRGEIVPGSTAEGIERDADQRLIRLAQDGWRITIVRYPPGEHDGLPRRLELARGSNEMIRLVIDGWRRDASAPAP